MTDILDDREQQVNIEDALRVVQTAQSHLRAALAIMDRQPKMTRSQVLDLHDILTELDETVERIAEDWKIEQ